MKRRYTYRHPLSKEEIERAIMLYKSERGGSCSDVAKVIGCSATTIWQIAKRYGIAKPRGGGEEQRLYIDGHYKRFGSLRSAARTLGMSTFALSTAKKVGRIATWPADKFREHPGLDCMPTPYPFTTKSAKLLEYKCWRKRKEVQDAGV